MDISCIVLAGGKGSRLGRDKTLETLGDKILLQWVIDGVSPLNSDIILVTTVEKILPQFTTYPRLRRVTDIYPDKGALGGIYTGLTTSDSFYNLVVASDMPFLNKALLHYMTQISANFDLVVPRLGNMIEPLHAIYSKACLNTMEHLIKQGKLQVRQLPALVKVR